MRLNTRIVHSLKPAREENKYTATKQVISWNTMNCTVYVFIEQHLVKHVQKILELC